MKSKAVPTKIAIIGILSKNHNKNIAGKQIYYNFAPNNIPVRQGVFNK
jgi:hypothetical protein